MIDRGLISIVSGGSTPPNPPEMVEAVLYNWPAIVDARKLAPVDFFVASEEDWADLLGYLGGYSEAGGKLKAIIGWIEPNVGATDEVDFSALSTGMRNADGTFTGKGTNSYHWVKNINE